ncbi:CIC_collapsed_G0026160.mRNA.1.CDS.1 [Saccharomyces cerevisiae]|nr:CIC_collapsed_G0026160.mRNA.1.CDS.1 [Saccharomyces cerevisiae]
MVQREQILEDQSRSVTGSSGDLLRVMTPKASRIPPNNWKSFSLVVQSWTFGETTNAILPPFVCESSIDLNWENEDCRRAIFRKCLFAFGWTMVYLVLEWGAISLVCIRNFLVYQIPQFLTKPQKLQHQNWGLTMVLGFMNIIKNYTDL